MSGNIFGKLLTLTTFGESHGKLTGGVLDGFPAGVDIDFELIKYDIQRRRPGQSAITTGRNEPDVVEYISGFHNGKTTGAPIAFFIHNIDIRPRDYENLNEVFRPSHADYTYYKKYGVRGISGGGRASARETIARVVAGSLAKCFLKKYNIEITAYTSAIGEIEIDKRYKELDLSKANTNPLRCPDLGKAKMMEKYLNKLKEAGDSGGGIIDCIITGVMPGLGEPVFDKLQARLASAIMSIPAVKGFEYGSGFSGSKMTGSEHNDAFWAEKNGKISTMTNFSGGIQGGISNGEDINFKVAFKPVSSIAKEQNTVDSKGNNTTIKIKGRHDSCIVPRAVPVVEAMAALVIADMILISGIEKTIH